MWKLNNAFIKLKKQQSLNDVSKWQCNATRYCNEQQQNILKETIVDTTVLKPVSLWTYIGDD